MKTAKKITNVEENKNWKNNYPSERYHNLEKIGGFIVVDNHGYHQGTIEYRMGRANNASVVHCTVRLWSKSTSLLTYGSAGGYGYDKKSASFAVALRNAGIKVQEVSGCGGEEVRKAFTELLRIYTGKRKFNFIAF